MEGLTLDTGALIALERRDRRMALAFALAVELHRPVTVPVVVVTEWWRGRSRDRDRILRAVNVEPMSKPLAQSAGEALAAVTGSSVVDVIVMASAARRGDIVYTADVDDLERIRAY